MWVCLRDVSCGMSNTIGFFINIRNSSVWQMTKTKCAKIWNRSTCYIGSCWATGILICNAKISQSTEVSINHDIFIMWDCYQHFLTSWLQQLPLTTVNTDMHVLPVPPVLPYMHVNAHLYLCTWTTCDNYDPSYCSSDLWKTVAQRDSRFKELLPAIWIRPTTWLHSVHETAVPISRSL